jgi:hypothetical protein
LRCSNTVLQTMSRKRASKASGIQTHFDEYGALKAYLGHLPPPKSGLIRVFRGQCKDYGAIRPTGIRVPLRNEQSWLQYCRMLATDILYQQGVPVETALSQARLWAYWYYAIVQHYGPGTHLLDVTHSLDVALWFALHRASVNKQINLAFANSRRTSPFPNLHREDEWTTYQEWKESPGVLYVFDVPPWAATERPNHGDLVDLSLGPDFFAKSARIHAQKGCLIAAQMDESEGNLAQFLAHPAIRVAWPLSGFKGADLPTDSLFPGPKEDEWYTRLLFLPVIPQVSRTIPYWRMAHPVTLSMYIEHLEAAQYAVAFNPLQPPLLFPWLISAVMMDNPGEAAADRAAKFVRSVPILLETPLVATLPEHDDAFWNHALLVQNLPTVIGALRVLEWEGGENYRPPFLLSEVLFELSPLECVGWTDLLRRGGQLQVPRAIHLVRDDHFAWRLQIFFQNAPREEIGTFFKEPASIRFDSVSQRFQLAERGEWLDIATNYVAAKSLLVALWLLRALSPHPYSPSPTAEVSKSAPAVLLRTSDLIAGMPYYLMRNSRTHEPFCAPDVESSH